MSAGSGTGYLVNNASGIAVGGTAIANDTGSGTLLAGDVVTFAADSVNKYIAGTTLAAGTFSLNAPGARVAIADNNVITIGGSYTANIALHQSAIELVMRPLAKPMGGDAAVDDMIVQDPFSGLVFRISAYKGYNKAMFDVTCLYQAKVWKSDFVAVLMG